MLLNEKERFRLLQQSGLEGSFKKTDNLQEFIKDSGEKFMTLLDDKPDGFEKPDLSKHFDQVDPEIPSPMKNDEEKITLELLDVINELAG